MARARPVPPLPVWRGEQLTDQGENPQTLRGFLTRLFDFAGNRPKAPVGGPSRSGLNPSNYGMGSVPRAPRRNEAEYGTPRTSRSGYDFKRAAGGNGLIRQMPPLIPQHVGMFVFKNFIGAFAQRPAQAVTVIRRYMYAGELPMAQQPILNKPRPWNDPTRGQP